MPIVNFSGDSFISSLTVGDESRRFAWLLWRIICLTRVISVLLLKLEHVLVGLYLCIFIKTNFQLPIILTIFYSKPFQQSYFKLFKLSQVLYIIHSGSVKSFVWKTFFYFSNLIILVLFRCYHEFLAKMFLMDLLFICCEKAKSTNPLKNLKNQFVR